MRRDEKAGDIFVVDGMDRPIPMGLVAAAGKPPEEIRTHGVLFEDMHRGGWDPDARMAEQERDGVAAEVIYPTVGMVLCNQKDFDYKKACFDAYNRWIAEYCAAHPERLLGCGQTAMRSPEEGIRDLEQIKQLGLRGVMMPGNPAVEDYDSPVYDDFWRAAIDIGLPLSFHILTTRGEHARGPAMNSFLTIVRGCQDIMGMLVLGGVFERHPKLKVVCVEADAGWVPHYMYRMDHAYKRHRNWLPPGQKLSKLPSEYFAENIYTTFQDDWVAFKTADLVNWRRLMWANDFPHSDSTWPWSQELLAEHKADLSDEQAEAILGANVAELYGIDLAPLQ
jgi:predicted TIM-barrel fold metal-dependent hydrolase